MIEIIDDENKVTCRLCGARFKRLYGNHFMYSHDNLSSKEYKKMFPGAPIMAANDLISTNKNSGLHMKEEKYKKMFSEKYMGEKNPNHKSNTTEEERKSRSPFSKSFVKYEGIEDVESHISEFVKEALKNRVTDNTKEYYMVRGYSEEESIKMVSKRQSTFSLEKCIDKYGEEDGHKRWLKRQKKWLTNYKKVNYSNISQEMFISLYKRLNEVGFSNKVYFARLSPDNKIHSSNRNYEFRLELGKSYILPDFFIPDFNLIIEFDGTYYHRNTIENKKREEKRDMEIINAGYKVLHIPESQYISDKESTIEMLVEYIRNINNV